MAARLTLSVLVLVIASISLSHALRGPGPKKCCFRYNEKPVPEKRVVSYIWTHQQCSNTAVLLKTVTGRELCVQPSAPWVKELIRRINSKQLIGKTSIA